jgi:succinate dehydrogenase/fumarate reductase flavoprotein subunit
MAQEEITVDVLVVGTGASGMATAVTAAAQDSTC